MNDSDEWNYGWACGLAAAMLSIGPDGSMVEQLLDPGYWYNEDAVCMAQQVVAEATGLVGVGDV